MSSSSNSRNSSSSSDSSSSNSSDTSLLANALGAAFASIIGRTCTHPLDTAKARLQAVYSSSSSSHSSLMTPHQKIKQPLLIHNPYRGPVDALVQTARTEGIGALYRGFGAVIVGGTPATILYLCSYDIAKQKFSSINSHENGEEGFAVHFSAGITAETISCLVYVPVDVVKERMQVQRSVTAAAASGGAPTYGTTAYYYKNSWDALQQIARVEGFSGVYRGYWATLASFGPFSGLYFLFYERFKFWARQYQIGHSIMAEPPPRTLEKGVGELDFSWILLCSAGAGALASWITSPLDLAKLRLQVSRGSRLAAAASNNPQQPSNSAVSYRGVIDCLQQAYRAGGIQGLFRGAGARVIHYTPATTITMTSYELGRSFIALHAY